MHMYVCQSLNAMKSMSSLSTIRSLPIEGKHHLYYYPDINLLTLDGDRIRCLSGTKDFQTTLFHFFLGLRRLKAIKETLQVPRTLFVEPWRTCNLSCTYCYAHAGPFHQKRVDEDWLHMLINRYSFKQVQIFGGEPLLDSQFLLGLYRSQQWDSFFFSTNGILLNQKDAGKLIALPKVSFQISLEPSEWSCRVTKKNKHQLGLLLPTLQQLNHPCLNLRVTIPPDAPYVPLKSLIRCLDEAVGGSHFTITYWVAHDAMFPQWVERWIQESYDLLRDDDEEKYKDKLPCHHLDYYFRETVERGFRFSNCNAGYGSVAAGPDSRLHGCHELAVLESDLDAISSSLDPLELDENKRLQLVYQWCNGMNSLSCNECAARYICGGICFVLRPPSAACLFLQRMLELVLTGMVRYAPKEAMDLASRSEETFNYLFSMRQTLGEEVKTEKWKQLVYGELPLAAAVELAGRFLSD